MGSFLYPFDSFNLPLTGCNETPEGRTALGLGRFGSPLYTLDRLSGSGNGTDGKLAVAVWVAFCRVPYPCFNQETKFCIGCGKGSIRLFPVMYISSDSGDKALNF